jgi:drug/metabolite transporter (DMT)-like permease
VGLTWVLLAAVLFGIGSVAQAAAVAALDDGRRLPWTALLRHPWFVAGTVAEGAGALCHVAALQSVSMAVAQCAVSASLAVTALTARVWFGPRLGGRGLVAVGVLSMTLVGLAAVSGQSGTATDTVALEIGLAVAAGAITVAGPAGAVAGRGVALAVCSGLGFAACSTAVKLVDLSRPLSALTSMPALVAAATGLLGCLWWTLALRHSTVTTATAVVVVAEVVPPSLLAPLLGDTVSAWFGVVAPVALALAATACVVLARGHRAASAVVEETPRVPVAA